MHQPNVTGGRDWTQVRVHPAAAVFPLMDDDEFYLLKADIQKHSQRDAITLTEHGEVLDGRNRLRACEELGIEPFCITLADDEGFDPIAYVISKNLARRHLTKSQAAAIAAEHLPIFAAEALVRKAAGQKTGGRGNKKTLGKNLPEVSEPAGKAVEKAAEAFGVSPETVRKAAKVKDASPDIHKQVKSGLITVHKAGQLMNPPAQWNRAAKAEREPGDDTELLKAEAAKRRASGRELVTPKERREATKAFGVVTRFVDKLKRHGDLREHLAAVLAVLEGKA